MLLRFTVENAFCFGPEASLSLVATNDDRHPSHVCSGKGSRPNVLRVAAIYGANGHGKTNLVRAIAALRELVAEQKWLVPRFRLDPSTLKGPTKMIIEFRFQEFDYEYGVVINGKVVSEEWLYRTSKAGKESKLFERTSKKTEDGFFTNVSTGATLKNMKSPVDSVGMDKYIEILSTGLKETRPFLSEARERKLSLLSPAYEWIVGVLTPVTATSNYAPLFERVDSDGEFRSFIKNFMKKCDIGIEDLSASSFKLEEETFSGMPSNLREQINSIENDMIIHLEGDDGISLNIERSSDGDLIVKKIGVVRLNSEGKKIDFSFEEESSGTRRLLDLAPMLAETDVERVYVVDELDRKLHPMLSYKFVEEFLAKRRDQLILTTHNTHLMDLDLLRRDEIWFVQKKSDGSSELYSLAEMKIRPDLNVEKGYINGRFGAIPFLGSFPTLNEK